MINPEVKQHCKRCGMTIVELTVALAVGAIVILCVAGFVDSLVRLRERIQAHIIQFDNDANADRLARGLIARAGGDIDSLHPFRGDAHVVAFPTLCLVPRGWLEHCRATIQVAALQHAQVIAASTSAGSFITLPGVWRNARLLYLNDPANGGQWSREWFSPVEAPFAIGLVRQSDSRADTLILRVGSRE
jgi:hypothetical protein